MSFIIERLFGWKPVPEQEASRGSEESESNDLHETLEKMADAVASGSPIQHTIVNFMSRMLHEDVAKRESGYKERQPRRLENIDVLIKTNKGRVIGAWLGKEGIKVAFRKGEFTKEEVFETLAETYPDFEQYNQPPPFLPEGWWDEGEKFLGLRKGPEGERDSPRAFWLIVREHQPSSLYGDMLNEKKRLENYWFGHRSLAVQSEAEVKDRYMTRKALDGSDDVWYLSPYSLRAIAEELGSEVQEKFADFLQRLLKDDKIISLSVRPGGFDVPMTPRKAEKYPEYHLEKKEKIFDIENGEIEGKIRNTVDEPNWRYGKYVFEIGENEYGILTKRHRSYVIPYLFTKTRLYPEGLPLSELQSEIERMRVM